MRKLRNVSAIMVSLLVIAVGSAQAQRRADLYFGMGTARVGASQGIDTGGGVILQAPSMGGVFGKFGGDLMITPTLGVGAAVTLRFAQADFLSGYKYRPVFYDFNGIWTPIPGASRVIPEFQAGFGGAQMRFYGGQPYYDYYSGRYTNYAGSENHFQFHFGGGLRFYVTDNVFLRPQIDAHWVTALNETFASRWVKAYTMTIGYTISQ